MSTAKLKRYIDARTPEERSFLAHYLRSLNLPPAKKTVAVAKATAEGLRRRSLDLEARRRCVALSGDELLARLADRPASTFPNSGRPLYSPS